MSQAIIGKDPAFLLRTLEYCTPHNRMVITRDGIAGIGENIVSTALNIDDRLTVDHSLALVSATDADPRDIRARCAAGQLNLMSGAYTTDGSGIQLYGSSNPGIGLGGPNTPSGITFTAQYNPSNEVAYKFCHYKTATGTMLTSFTINNQLNARFGPGAPGGERLTVDGNLYLYDASDAPRGVVGHSYSGAIDVSSGTNATDGSRIRLFAQNNSANPGQITFSALGANGTSRAFTFSTKNTGTAAVADKLALDIDGKAHLSNDVDFSLLSAATGVNIKGLSTNALNLYSASDDATGSALQLKSAQLRLVAGNGGAATASAFSLLKRDNAGNTWKSLLDVHNDGKVVIGDNATLAAPGTYKLYVEDGIMTEKVRVAVKTTTSWADYVFADDYRLAPLAEVAAYAQQHKHLPGVPSAQEVVDRGIDMAEMDAKLLQKVEELTLYVIQLKKEVEALKSKGKH